MVVPGSVVGTAQQVRNELEIQRAYHWLLSTDVNKRRAVEPSSTPARERRPVGGERVAGRQHRDARVAR